MNWLQYSVEDRRTISMMWPSHVRSVDVKEQVNKRMRNNRRISTDEMRMRCGKKRYKNGLRLKDVAYMPHHSLKN
jgi:hypothetical protein